MGESHACGSRIVISRIQTNFSRLSDNSDKTFEKSQHLRNSLIIARDSLEILWKSLACPVFEIIENLSTTWVIFGSRQEIFASLSKTSVTFGRHQ